MFQVDPGLWPIRTDGGDTPGELRGGVAPLRHELALANYLEKQAKLRSAGTPDARGIANICDAAVRVCVAGRRALATLATRRPGSRFA